MPEHTPRADDNVLLLTAIKKLDELDQSVNELRHDIRGNGEKGLKQRMARAESHLYKNPHTAEPGIVKRVHDHAHLLNAVRAQMRLLNWLLSFLLGSGVVWVIRAVFLPVS